MFGHGYFGASYYGPSYFGPDDGGAPPAPGGTRNLPIVLPNCVGRMTAQLGGLIVSKSRRTDLGSS